MEQRTDPAAPVTGAPAPDAGPGAPAEPDAGDAAAPAGSPAVPAPAPRPVPRTVAELVAEALHAAGVRIAFTVPGESFLSLLDALVRSGIRVVAMRHEGAAAFAAGAHGQLTGRPAACLATRAVGAANLAVGIHAARADSAPMFALVGDVATGARGREAFQEADLVGTIGGLAGWAARIDDAALAPGLLARAVGEALGDRPGPVLLALPEDVLDAPVAGGSPVPRPRPAAPEPEDVRAVLHLLAAAERPVILAGAGVLRARCSTDVVRLAELLHVPVVASWRRGDVVPNDHPLYLGMTGFGAPAIVHERLAAADAMLVLGCRLGEITTGGWAVPAPGQPWIHVDAEPRTGAVGSSPAPLRAIRADARLFVRAALARLKDAALVAAPRRAREAATAADRAAWERAAAVDGEAWSGPGVHPGRVVATLRWVLPDDAIVATDAGSFAGWLARGFAFRRPGTFLGPTSGAMGYGLPAALAAALVHPERRVVAVAGDGGLGMVLAELETAVRERAHVVVLAFDNEAYGMIRERQAPAAGRPGTALGPVDFAAAARALGARGVRVETDAAFEPALRAALAAPGPSVLHLRLDPRWGSVGAGVPGTAVPAGEGS